MYFCFSPPLMYIPCFWFKFIIFKMLPTLWKYPKERKGLDSSHITIKLSTGAIPVVFTFLPYVI